MKQIPDFLLGKRDRALLLVGFTGVFRSSELIGLNVEDLDRAHPSSKTDQEGGTKKTGHSARSRLRGAHLIISEEPIPGLDMSEAEVVREVFQVAAVEKRSCRVIAAG